MFIQKYKQLHFNLYLPQLRILHIIFIKYMLLVNKFSNKQTDSFKRQKLINDLFSDVSFGKWNRRVGQVRQYPHSIDFEGLLLPIRKPRRFTTRRKTESQRSRSVCLQVTLFLIFDTLFLYIYTYYFVFWHTIFKNRLR